MAGSPHDAAASAAGADEGRGMAERTLTIRNQRGLHARAAAKFVKLSESFESEISVEKDGQRVGGRSIMGLMMLAAAAGEEITITAEGPDAGAALDALEKLVAAGFHEGG